MDVDNGVRLDVANMWCDRFFWLALYAQPGLWIGLAIFAIVKFEFTWLILVGKPALSLLCYIERVAESTGVYEEGA